jgi:hypothetical protein
MATVLLQVHDLYFHIVRTAADLLAWLQCTVAGAVWSEH